jgi:hypothetical protein
VFIFVLFFLASLLLSAPSAQAGCGCEKPPPAAASVRPNATYAGQPVTLFHSSFQPGVTYNVTFAAMNGQSATASAQAVNKRDLADGVYKKQVIVNVPSSLPLGPTGITVKQAGQMNPFMSVPDSNFVVTPTPIVIPSQVGEFRYQNFQAAVGRNGVVYLSLDLTGVTQPRVFRAQAKGYALRFTHNEVVIANTQGFLMQLLDQSIPGLFAISASSGSDSDTLQYSRHEFNTFFLQHGERQSHKVDPDDGNWHLDGTRHIDHDHLILAISGALSNGPLPTPGATPSFELVVNLATLFHQGLVGVGSAILSGTTSTDSYNSQTGLSGSRGDVLSNGTVTLKDIATVNGNATAAAFSISFLARINGSKITATQPTQFLPVSLPQGLTDLGSINVSGLNTRILSPGSYKVTDVNIKDLGQLLIDNTAGPVTLYVTGQVLVSGGGKISVADPDPEKFALYVAGNKSVSLLDAGTFAGVVYAPQSVVTLGGVGEFWGSFIGQQMKLTGSARVHYDTALRGE